MLVFFCIFSLTWPSNPFSCSSLTYGEGAALNVRRKSSAAFQGGRAPRPTEHTLPRICPPRAMLISMFSIMAAFSGLTTLMPLTVCG